MAHLLIHSKLLILMSDCEPFHSLRLLRTNKWMFFELRAQVDYNKRMTVSKLLRLLMIKEQMSELLSFFSESLICSFPHKKTSNLLNICRKKSNFLYVF